MSSEHRSDVSHGPRPFKPFHIMLQQELDQASEELERETQGLLISSISAGIGIGVSVGLIAAVHANAASLAPILVQLLAANMYAVGFVIVILGRMDLFTEFTTIAILPVLAGRATLRGLARFWGIIYAGNLLGALIFAAFAVTVTPSLGTMDRAVYERLALDLAMHDWWIIVLSATLAGWLMGALSWLIIGGRDTISQLFFVWLIAFAIGFGHLHHVVIGTVEMLCGMMVSKSVSVGLLLKFVVWSTLGNTVGGILFAMSVQYSIRKRKRNGSDRPH